MRIAFVTDTFENGIAGGVVTGVRFVEALRQRHEVTVVATGEAAPGKVVLPGFQLPLRIMRENRMTFAWPSRATLEKVFAEVDVVHVNFPFLLGLRAVRIARRMRVPVVAAFHVQPENLLMNAGVRSRLLANWLYRRWVRSFFNRADGALCPSRFALERLQQFGLAVPALVVSNGAPVRRAMPALRAADRTQAITILCLGRLAREKRQDVILDAVARCRHHNRIALVIAGAGPRERALRAQAERLGVSAEIGYVSEQRLREVLAQATLFVHASEVELEGMALLDAMAAGLPVLVADAPDSAAPQFAMAPDFLFRPGDADDLAAHLDSLLDSPSALAAGRRHSLKEVVRYDFQHSVRMLEQFYAALAAEAHLSEVSATEGRASARP